MQRSVKPTEERLDFKRSAAIVDYYFWCVTSIDGNIEKKDYRTVCESQLEHFMFLWYEERANSKAVLSRSTRLVYVCVIGEGMYK